MTPGEMERLKRDMDSVGIEVADTLPPDDLLALPKPSLNQLNSSQPSPLEMTDATSSGPPEEVNDANVDTQC